MQRVYTDERFPGIQIENRGTFKFYVMQDGKLVQTFTAKEVLGQAQVSEAFAQRRAADYFERWARMDLSGEFAAQQGQPAAQAAGEPAAKANPQEVERAIAASRAEMDPVRKKELELKALALMGREESLAEQTVNHLLHEG